MAIGTTLATGVGVSRAFGFDPIEALGGREQGYGQAKPGTLEWYIDKLKGINDLEAIEMAEIIIQMRLNGVGNSEIASFLKSESDEKVLGPEELNPILRKLDEVVGQAQQQQAQQQTAQQAGAGGLNIAGFGLLQILLLAGAGFAIFKVANQ